MPDLYDINESLRAFRTFLTTQHKDARDRADGYENAEEKARWMGRASGLAVAIDELDGIEETITDAIEQEEDGGMMPAPVEEAAPAEEPAEDPDKEAAPPWSIKDGVLQPPPGQEPPDLAEVLANVARGLDTVRTMATGAAILAVDQEASAAEAGPGPERLTVAHRILAAYNAGRSKGLRAAALTISQELEAAKAGKGAL